MVEMLKVICQGQSYVCCCYSSFGGIFRHTQMCSKLTYSTYAALLPLGSTCLPAVDKLNVIHKLAAVI